MPSRALGAAVGLIAMAAFLLPANAQNVRPVPLSTIIDHNTQILEFVCRGPLSAEERRRFAAVTTQQVRQDPVHWYQNDVLVVQDMQTIRDYPGRKRAEEWLKYRFIYATQDVEGTRIASVHDPIVVLDAQRHILITEQTLITMQQAAQWVAKVTGRPQPDAQYVAKMRNTLRQNWRSWPEQKLLAATNIMPNWSATVQYARSLPEAQGKAVVAGLAKAPLPEPDNSFELATAMSHYNSDSNSARSSNGPSDSQATDNMIDNWVFQQNMARGACVAQYSGSGKFTTGAGAFCRPIP